jgi:hypothetical protein
MAYLPSRLSGVRTRHSYIHPWTWSTIPLLRWPHAYFAFVLSFPEQVVDGLAAALQSLDKMGHILLTILDNAVALAYCALD